MTRDTLERVIKKGAGLLDEQVNYELVTYEGFGPHRVPVVVECLTENRTRTATNVRHAVPQGPAGRHRRGDVGLRAPGRHRRPGAGRRRRRDRGHRGRRDDLEAGDEGQTHFFTAPTDLDAVRKALEAAGWAVESAALVWRAQEPGHARAGARAPRWTRSSPRSTRTTTCRTSSSRSASFRLSRGSDGISRQDRPGGEVDRAGGEEPQGPQACPRAGRPAEGQGRPGRGDRALHARGEHLPRPGLRAEGGGGGRQVTSFAPDVLEPHEFLRPPLRVEQPEGRAAHGAEGAGAALHGEVGRSDESSQARRKMDSLGPGR